MQTIKFLHYTDNFQKSIIFGPTPPPTRKQQKNIETTKKTKANQRSEGQTSNNPWENQKNKVFRPMLAKVDIGRTTFFLGFSQGFLLVCPSHLWFALFFFGFLNGFCSPALQGAPQGSSIT